MPNNYFHRPIRIGSSDISWSHAYQLRVEYIRSRTSQYQCFAVFTHLQDEKKLKHDQQKSLCGIVYNYLKAVSYNLFIHYAVRNGGLC